MDKDLLKEAQDAFARCQEVEADNREKAKADLRFAREDEQWPEQIRKQREADGRPCLTINKLPPIIRQVVNDGRQNKPSISVHPRDSQSDPRTAEVMNGLIRQIEQSSQADAAYDTALEHAVTFGFGFIRVNTAYADDDSFDQDIVLDRVADPFTIWGDPESTAVDSSDWNVAFVTEAMTKAAFERQYKGADPVDWSGDYKDCKAPWLDGEHVTVAEYWTREKSMRNIVLLDDGTVLDEEVYVSNKALFDGLGRVVVGSRPVESHKVKQRILTGAEVISKREWGGRYIPIIPVYGEEIFIDGRRQLRGITRSAIDAQRNFNYWRSAATESVALAPLAPWVGPKGAFHSDAAKWATANRHPHAFLEYDIVGDGGQNIPAPTRLNPPQVAAGAIQEALNAADDIKSITGIHDASLGARSNETSGRAIMARQREGDISTFHYLDNLSRAIRHTGRIVLDLIPTVYSGPRIVRVLGQDMKPSMVQVNQPVADPANGASRVFDLTAGKYDLTVKVGPSFTSQREETATQMMELIRVFPQAAPVVGDLLAQNLDWPGADELGRRLKAMLPPPVQGQNPEVEQLKLAGQKLIAELQATKAELASVQADHRLEAEKLAIEKFKADTDRLEAEHRITLDLRNGGQQPGNPALY